MKKYNRVLSALSIAIGGIILVLSKDFQQIDVHGNPAEGFWPRLIAMLFICLGILLALVTSLKKREVTTSVNLGSAAVRKAYAACGCSVLYGFLMILVGFIIATPLFIPSIMLLLGEKRLKIIAIVAGGITVSIWLIFKVLFKSSLPSSILFG